MTSGVFNRFTGYHHRRSIRLRNYDYSRPGAYFVTVCAYDADEEFFGQVENDEMKLNEYGNIVLFTWNDLTNHIGNITLDAFVIMPNHVHGIIHIVGTGDVGAGSEPAPTDNNEPAPTITTKNHSLPEIIRQFKTFSAKGINQLRNATGVPVWQRNYYEHVIRNEKSLFAIRRYIKQNPRETEPSENGILGKMGFGDGTPIPANNNVIN